MRNNEKIKITIMGKEREFTLPQLVELYKQLEDPYAESHAESNFHYHRYEQNRKAHIDEARKTPEGILKFVEVEFSDDYDYNLNTFSGNVRNDVFALAAELPVEMLEEFSKKIDDETYKSKLQSILDEKIKLNNNTSSDETDIK